MPPLRLDVAMMHHYIVTLHQATRSSLGESGPRGSGGSIILCRTCAYDEADSTKRIREPPGGRMAFREVG
jgi:hypothetical protein